jgi:hypothetical protein
MGCYVYKVTSKTVDLDNGEQANVAVYAYKPTWRWDGETLNDRWHFRSGAGTCDRHAHKRTGWLVYGYVEDDGRVTVDGDGRAFKIGDRKFGSFNDGAMDFLLDGDDVQHAVQHANLTGAASKGVVVERTRAKV